MIHRMTVKEVCNGICYIESKTHHSRETQMLSRKEAKVFYDRLGAKQDAQMWYEAPALALLKQQIDFDQCHQVFELGCGTGAFAKELLEQQLPTSAAYWGADISQTMLSLTKQKLSQHAERVTLLNFEKKMTFPVDNSSFDLFLSNYVLDLLAEHEIQEVIQQAHRLLRNDGILAITSITRGMTLVSRIRMSVWSLLHKIRPSLVGGCRPLPLETFLSANQWHIKSQETVTRYGIASTVIIAHKR